jgi:hypothetical protein
MGRPRNDWEGGETGRGEGERLKGVKESAREKRKGVREAGRKRE